MPNSPDAILRESEAEPPPAIPHPKTLSTTRLAPAPPSSSFAVSTAPISPPAMATTKPSAISSPELASILSTSISNATTAHPANSNVQEPHQPQRPSPSP